MSSLSFFQKLRQKDSLFIFITVDKLYIILQESRVTFYFNVFKEKKPVLKKVSEQVPAVYNRIKCMSLKIPLENLNRMFSK